eukprot:TRINITY_DN50872_c0_g1_i1.p1 TRINITY_DN50872_c0_g1~~TRINITY_DN50872_c0_g1_i1.p1  ORF type:complete len:202 (+),score=49.21 TRINITY_DN50872_c0_g1_i1:62-667(+)
MLFLRSPCASVLKSMHQCFAALLLETGFFCVHQFFACFASILCTLFSAMDRQKLLPIVVALGSCSIYGFARSKWGEDFWMRQDDSCAAAAASIAEERGTVINLLLQFLGAAALLAALFLKLRCGDSLGAERCDGKEGDEPRVAASPTSATSRAAKRRARLQWPLALCGVVVLAERAGILDRSIFAVMLVSGFLLKLQQSMR